jgi:hypothetical protein
MIVWGGSESGSIGNAGGRYDPATDTWVATSTGAGVPSPRLYHTAVWTDTEMIVWGGFVFSAAGGGAYCASTECVGDACDDEDSDDEGHDGDDGHADDDEDEDADDEGHDGGHGDAERRGRGFERRGR